jgi:hypothetical protein
MCLRCTKKSEHGALGACDHDCMTHVQPQLQNTYDIAVLRYYHKFKSTAVRRLSYGIVYHVSCINITI